MVRSPKRLREKSLLMGSYWDMREAWDCYQSFQYRKYALLAVLGDSVRAKNLG